jgi:hypothetical protein
MADREEEREKAIETMEKNETARRGVQLYLTGGMSLSAVPEVLHEVETSVAVDRIRAIGNHLNKAPHHSAGFEVCMFAVTLVSTDFAFGVKEAAAHLFKHFVRVGPDQEDLLRNICEEVLWDAVELLNTECPLFVSWVWGEGAE